jgi:hypothetical protein
MFSAELRAKLVLGLGILVWVLTIAAIDSKSWVKTKFSYRDARDQLQDATQAFGLTRFSTHHPLTELPDLPYVNYRVSGSMGSIIPGLNTRIKDASPSDPYHGISLLSASSLDATATFLGLAAALFSVHIFFACISNGWLAVGGLNAGAVPTSRHAMARAMLPAIGAVCMSIGMIIFAASHTKSTLCRLTVTASNEPCGFGSAYGAAVTATVFSIVWAVLAFLTADREVLKPSVPASDAFSGVAATSEGGAEETEGGTYNDL